MKRIIKSGKPEIWFSVLALIVSILSLVTAIRSCRISQESHSLNKQQYLDSFLTICTGEYLKEIEAIKISPTNKNVTIQNASAFYPDAISDAGWPIEPPNFYLYIILPKSNVERLFRSNIHAESKFMQFFPEINIPVILGIYYTLNGENRYDKSLYYLEFPSLLVGGELRDTCMGIKGLIFRERLNSKVNTKKYLNRLWEEIKAPLKEWYEFK